MKRLAYTTGIIVLVVIALLPTGATRAGINFVDYGEYVGRYSSLVLDANGYPVISYEDYDDSTLKLAHCNDPGCTGGDENIEVVDASCWGVDYTSLALDANGHPVISYHCSLPEHDFPLKVAHCNDPNCAGGDESLEEVGSGSGAEYISLVLDANGHPVISYYDPDNHNLKLVHCNDPNCAGGDESIVVVDSGGFSTGHYVSLVLDASGYPVLSYFHGNHPDYALRLAHCNDPNCAGGNESIVDVITSRFGATGSYTSLVLDANGHPVISFLQNPSYVKLVHCNDPNCAGGNESLELIEPYGSGRTSLALDADGNPVVSSWGTQPDVGLMLVRCNDPNCADGSAIIGTVGDYETGPYAMVLDANDNPVLSYYGGSDPNLGLKLYTAATVTLGFANAANEVDETAGAVATVRLTVSNGPATGVYTASVAHGGTATGGGVDYTGADTVTFDCTGGCANGTHTQDVVTIIDDTLGEADETVILTLSNPTGGATLGPLATHTVTIADDDRRPPGCYRTEINSVICTSE